MVLSGLYFLGGRLEPFINAFHLVIARCGWIVINKCKRSDGQTAGKVKGKVT